MLHAVLAFVLLIIALSLPRLLGMLPADFSSYGLRIGIRTVLVLAALWLILGTSLIMIPADKIGVTKKIYGTASLPEGHIIATQGETGYQAEPIPPGTFRIALFYNIFNTIEYLPITVVPNGYYGRIVARDGQNLREGQIMADAWPDEEFAKFLDAQYFMTHGGQRGEQLSVLKPGTYPINTVLFQIKIGYKANGKDILKDTDDVYDENGHHEETTPLDTSITKVPAGFVGVVRSSVQAKDAKCEVIKAKVDTFDSLSAELVPQHCKGIWAYALPPNDYYLNRDAYDVTLMSTRVQTLEFKGGFTRRWVDLTLNSKGDFEQKERPSSVIAQPPDAVDPAVNTKIEGWEIPQELRAVVQISPEHAPIIVAAVGGLKEVETRIMIPSIRSHVRNVYGSTIQVTEHTTQPDGTIATSIRERPTKVLDTVEQRTALEDEILKRVQVDGRRAGVDVKEIRLGESVIPPELLLARQREQLATQLRSAFIQEQAAQKQRQETEQARVTADQQVNLVTAQINLETSKLNQSKRQQDGHGERLFLEEQAAGQKAQVDVLGKDSVILLKQFEMGLELLSKHPEIIANQKWPQTLFVGGNSLENAAGIISAVGKLGQAVESKGKPAPQP